MDRWNWNPSSQINAKKIRQWIPENGSWRAGADDRVTIHPPSGGPIVGRAWTATVSTANSDGIYEYLTTCPPPSLFPAFCCRSLSSSVPSLWSRLSLYLSRKRHTQISFRKITRRSVAPTTIVYGGLIAWTLQLRQKVHISGTFTYVDVLVRCFQYF